MLIEFSVANFLSFREKVTLSLVKGKGSELEESNTITVSSPNTPDLLKSVVVYGANAAGKSNLITAMYLMREIVEDSAKERQSGESLAVTPFCLDDTSSEKPCEFEIAFVVGGIRYNYGFSATRERIVEEWLYAYPKGRQQIWIERMYLDDIKGYVWGRMDKLTGNKQVWKDSTRPNALFLSTAIQLNSHQLKPVFDWFAFNFRVSREEAWSDICSINLCYEEKTKKKVTDFLKAADLNIIDIEVVMEKFNATDLPTDMPEGLRKDIVETLDGKSIPEIKTVHLTDSGRKKLLSMDVESDGTQKIFRLAGPWIDSLEEGYTVVIDELNLHLHPLMLKFLLQLFNDPESNPKGAQLVFTTHETSILDSDILRRDQIWFCEKTKNQSTLVYPLTDFSPRKKVENLERGYLSGRYGALPYVDRLSTSN